MIRKKKKVTTRARKRQADDQPKPQETRETRARKRKVGEESQVEPEKKKTRKQRKPCGEDENKRTREKKNTGKNGKKKAVGEDLNLLTNKNLHLLTWNSNICLLCQEAVLAGGVVCRTGCHRKMHEECIIRREPEWKEYKDQFLDQIKTDPQYWCYICRYCAVCTKEATNKKPKLCPTCGVVTHPRCQHVCSKENN